MRSTVNDLGNWDLRESGMDGLFDTGDDIVYDLQVSPQYTTGTLIELLVADGPLGEGDYRLTLSSSVMDVVGNAFDGNGDGTGGDSFTRTFSVMFPGDSTFEGTDNDTQGTATALPLTEDRLGADFPLVAVSVLLIRRAIRIGGRSTY